MVAAAEPGWAAQGNVQLVAAQKRPDFACACSVDVQGRSKELYVASSPVQRLKRAAPKEVCRARLAVQGSIRQERLPVQQRELPRPCHPLRDAPPKEVAKTAQPAAVEAVYFRRDCLCSSASRAPATAPAPAAAAVLSFQSELG